MNSQQPLALAKKLKGVEAMQWGFEEESHFTDGQSEAQSGMGREGLPAQCSLLQALDSAHSQIARTQGRGQRSLVGCRGVEWGIGPHSGK